MIVQVWGQCLAGGLQHGRATLSSAAVLNLREEGGVQVCSRDVDVARELETCVSCFPFPRLVGGSAWVRAKAQP